MPKLDEVEAFEQKFDFESDIKYCVENVETIVIDEKNNADDKNYL